MSEVAVVGAGPAGTTAARILAQSGRDVVVLEERREPGAVAHCTGLVTDDVIKMSGVRPDVIGTVCAADVIFPGGRRISLERRSPIAYVVDRPGLDRRLADAAARYGADVRYGVHCASATAEASRVVLRTNVGDMESKILVGADGQGSSIAMSLGDNAPREVLRGAQVDVKHRCDDQTRMVLRLGSEYAPGFFSWEIPIGDLTRVGVCIGSQYGMPSAYLKKVLLDSGYGGCVVERRFGGKIPIGGRRTSYGNRTLLIGDAAGQVKPVSGGGLYPIFKAAPILADTVNRALDENIFSSAHLALYERGWRRELGKSFAGGARLRRAFLRMGDADMDSLGKALDTEGAREALSMIDLDDPASAVRPLLAQKGVKSAVLKALVKAYL